jgi:hypothetical protein
VIPLHGGKRPPNPVYNSIVPKLYFFNPPPPPKKFLGTLLGGGEGSLRKTPCSTNHVSTSNPTRTVRTERDPRHSCSSPELLSTAQHTSHWLSITFPGNVQRNAEGQVRSGSAQQRIRHDLYCDNDVSLTRVSLLAARCVRSLDTVTFTFQHGQSCGDSSESELSGEGVQSSS